MPSYIIQSQMPWTSIKYCFISQPLILGSQITIAISLWHDVVAIVFHIVDKKDMFKLKTFIILQVQGVFSLLIRPLFLAGFDLCYYSNLPELGTYQCMQFKDLRKVYCSENSFAKVYLMYICFNPSVLGRIQMYWYSTTKALRQDWVIRTAKESRKKGISKKEVFYKTP